MGIPFANGAVAFGLTCGAGLCTCLGASVVYFPSLVKFTDNAFLAKSLSLAAGVMIYVSFIEIFLKSQVRPSSSCVHHSMFESVRTAVLS